MNIEEFFSNSNNTGKVKRRVNIDDEPVSECMDTVSSKAYVENFFRTINASSDVIELLDIKRCSVMNMCRAFFYGFSVSEMSRSIPKRMLSTTDSVIKVYIQKYYKNDCFECFYSFSNKNSDVTIDAVVDYAIKNLKVYKDEDLAILMMFMGLFFYRAIKNNVIRSNDDMNNINPLLKNIAMN